MSFRYEISSQNEVRRTALIAGLSGKELVTKAQGPQAGKFKDTLRKYLWNYFLGLHHGRV